MTRMDKQLDSEALRSLIRDVLRELVPAAVARARETTGPATVAKPVAQPSGIVETRFEEVGIADDAQLAAFVQRVLGLFDDPATREAVRTGRHAFRLARSGGDGAIARNSGDAKAPLDKGVLSESKVISLARAGQRIVIGKSVVVTPLAKDKARQLGVKLERKT